MLGKKNSWKLGPLVLALVFPTSFNIRVSHLSGCSSKFLCFSKIFRIFMHFPKEVRIPKSKEIHLSFHYRENLYNVYCNTVLRS